MAGRGNLRKRWETQRSEGTLRSLSQDTKTVTCEWPLHDRASLMERHIDKFTTPKVQKLPDDLMITIVNLVASRGTKRQLANIALVSKRMYGIAIPKLYRRIEVTDRIQDELTYGCTPSHTMGLHGTSHSWTR